MPPLALARALSRNWRRPHWRIVFLHDVPHAKIACFRAMVGHFSDFFEWVSLAEGLQRITAGTLVGPCMTLTFDDAHKSVGALVPVLAELRIPACIYAVPEYIENGTASAGKQGAPIMSWHELAEWQRAGHEVGSHSLSHPALTACSDGELRRQFQQSRQRLEQRLGTPVEHFAYPFGQFDHRTQRVVKELGCYRSVATSERGAMAAGHDPLALRRDRLNLDLSPTQNEAWMRLADRLYWLRHVKRLARRAAKGRGSTSGVSQA